MTLRDFCFVGLVCELPAMAEQLKSFVRIKQVIMATGMSRSWIYEAMRRREFPQSISLGARSIGWDAAAVAEWQAQRIFASG
jgi:prophage regulatory protein